MHELKAEVSRAIAGGVPDNEYIGYSNKALTALLKVALKRIEYLENTLRENNTPFTETD